LARLERRAFRQAHFEEDLGTQGRRKEFLPYGGKKEDGGDEADDDPQNTFLPYQHGQKTPFISVAG